MPEFNHFIQDGIPVFEAIGELIVGSLEPVGLLHEVLKSRCLDGGESKFLVVDFLKVTKIDQLKMEFFLTGVGALINEGWRIVFVLSEAVQEFLRREEVFELVEDCLCASRQEAIKYSQELKAAEDALA